MSGLSQDKRAIVSALSCELHIAHIVGVDKIFSEQNTASIKQNFGLGVVCLGRKNDSTKAKFIQMLDHRRSTSMHENDADYFTLYT